MKTIRLIVVAATVFLATTGAQAGCLAQLRADSEACSGQYTFERIGCNIDAGIDYVKCVGRAATT
jgi:hypothetical protein